MKALLFASAAALVAGAAFAQQAAPSAPKADNAAAPAAQANATAPAGVTDAEVKGVAALAAEVKALNATHQPKITAAADAAAKTAAQNELDAAIQGALTKNGLTVDRYNEIARAAQADRALAARIAAASAGSASTGASSPSSATEPAREKP